MLRDEEIIKKLAKKGAEIPATLAQSTFFSNSRNTELILQQVKKTTVPKEFVNHAVSLFLGTKVQTFSNGENN